MFRFILLLVVGCSSSHSHATPDAPGVVVVVDAPPLFPYGAPCTASSQCAGAVCATGTCSRECSLAVADDCKTERAFCVPASGANVCAGHIDTGSDNDDAVLRVGDSVWRSLTPLGDADLFLVQLDIAGTIWMNAIPADSGLDLELDVYNNQGEPTAAANTAAAGYTEHVYTVVTTPGSWMFAVVRDVGPSTGDYRFS